MFALNWIKNSSFSIKVLGVALFIAYVLLMALKNIDVSAEVYIGLLLLTLIIPPSMLVIFVTENDIYKSLSDTKWTSVVISLAIAIYVALANIWAGVEINRIFEVAPSNFPYATTALTVVYFLNTIMLPLAQYAFYAIMLLSSLWVIYALVIDFQSIKTFMTRLMFVILVTIYLGTVMGGTSSIDRNKDFYAIKIAHFADFNKYNRCTSPMPKDIEGVVFLPSGSVLVSHKIVNSDVPSWNFKVLPCNPI